MPTVKMYIGVGSEEVTSEITTTVDQSITCDSSNPTADNAIIQTDES